MELGGQYAGGNARMVEKVTRCRGEEFLYVGDHIFTDVNMAKRCLSWRTCMILQARNSGHLGPPRAISGHLSHGERLASANSEPISADFGGSRERGKPAGCVSRTRVPDSSHGTSNRSSSKRWWGSNRDGRRASSCALSCRVATSMPPSAVTCAVNCSGAERSGTTGAAASAAAAAATAAAAAARRRSGRCRRLRARSDCARRSRRARRRYSQWSRQRERTSIVIGATSAVPVGPTRATSCGRLKSTPAPTSRPRPRRLLTPLCAWLGTPTFTPVESPICSRTPRTSDSPPRRSRCSMTCRTPTSRFDPSPQAAGTSRESARALRLEPTSGPGGGAPGLLCVSSSRLL